jgi:hypothetical protein
MTYDIYSIVYFALGIIAHYSWNRYAPKRYGTLTLTTRGEFRLNSINFNEVVSLVAMAKDGLLNLSKKRGIPRKKLEDALEQLENRYEGQM